MRTSPLPCSAIGAGVFSVSGHADALQAIVRRHAPYVASIALRITGRPEDVDDVVQEVFIRASRALGSLRDVGALRGWLASITVRVASAHVRARQVRAWLGLQSAPEIQEVPAPGATPEQRLMITAVYRVLDRIPVKQRVAWVLRYVEQFELAEIARHCSCSLAAVKRRLVAAQEVLDRSITAWRQEELDV